MKTPYWRVIISASMYAGSFIGATFLWPLSFLCYIPLFQIRFFSIKQAAGWGFVWGLFAYGCTLSALLDVAIRMGEGSFLSYLCAASFLIYFASGCALWFMGVFLISRIMNNEIIPWLIATIIYVVIIYEVGLSVLTGSWHGYPLVLPLLPLAQFPLLLSLLPWVGYGTVLCFLLCFQAGVAHKKRWLTILGLTPFIVGFLLKEKKAPSFLDGKIIPIAHHFKEQLPYERAQEVCQVLLNAEAAFPEALLLVLPESAFPFPLNEHSYALKMWQYNGNLFEKYVVVPSHYRVGEKGVLHNSAYVLHKSRIIVRYDKKLLVPFFETPSTNLFFKDFYHLFLQGKEIFAPGLQKKSPWLFLNQYPIDFCICSELLWSFSHAKTMLILVHDGYYRFSYFPSVFELLARFRAVELDCNVIYASWKRSFIA